MFCAVLFTQCVIGFVGQEAMYCLLEVVAMAPKQLAPHFVKHIDWLKVCCLLLLKGFFTVISDQYGLAVFSVSSCVFYTYDTPPPQPLHLKFMGWGYNELSKMEYISFFFS